MSRFKQYPEIFKEDIVKRARKLNSSLLADAMDGANSMSYKISPVAQGYQMIGAAVTVSMKPGDNLFLHEAIYSGGPGYVLIADGKGHTKNAYMGELMAAAAEALGLEGIVIDGLVRDRSDLQALTLPIYAKGFVPNGPYKDGPGAINIPVACGGVTVEPGDLIVGDDDGVTVVPKDELEQVFRRAEKKQAYEKQRLQEIAAFKKEREAGGKSLTIEPSWLKDKIKPFLK
ncbi:RraA family protein [Alkalihalobacillus xiaoxiensis]|uniref:Putative 4-hydroxy-4-methyl-2-oxoglutarate aldolase n=1 Tax=Shouchella xiaoxiensis TaxID=766895 RepID=A0ABS2SVP2_9BACI|nr:RraA family protein [Shouchella xiaoxiensis]MBM7839081.1 RraA family protein [Shouchella xiaoxiensis]